MSDNRLTLAALRTAAARYRSDLRAHKQLEREIAEYRSASERQDLYALLSRHTAEEIAPIERIIYRHAAAGADAR